MKIISLFTSLAFVFAPKEADVTSDGRAALGVFSSSASFSADVDAGEFSVNDEAAVGVRPVVLGVRRSLSLSLLLEVCDSSLRRFVGESELPSWRSFSTRRDDIIQKVKNQETGGVLE
jgi:hypothetical protein